jgi:hypothetical protein
MQANELNELFEYYHWANARGLSAAAKATLEQITAQVHLSYASLWGTLARFVIRG